MNLDKKISNFTKELENCTLRYDAKQKFCSQIPNPTTETYYNKCLSTAATNEFADIGLDIKKCYLKIGNKIIDIFYNKNKAEMSKSLKHFSQAIDKSYSDLYLLPQFCPEKCGLFSQQLSRQASNQNLYFFITKMLENTHNHNQ